MLPEALIENLASGAASLSDGVSELAESAASLSAGAASLSEGVETFDEEGVSKIIEKFGGETAKILERFTKILELGKETSDARYLIKIDTVKAD